MSQVAKGTICRVITEWRNDMGQAVVATQLLFNLLGGLGIFFLGVGVLWFVTVYKEKSK